MNSGQSDERKGEDEAQQKGVGTKKKHACILAPGYSGVYSFTKTPILILQKNIHSNKFIRVCSAHGSESVLLVRFEKKASRLETSEVHPEIESLEIEVHKREEVVRKCLFES